MLTFKEQLLVAHSLNDATLRFERGSSALSKYFCAVFLLGTISRVGDDSFVFCVNHIRMNDERRDGHGLGGQINPYLIRVYYQNIRKINVTGDTIDIEMDDE